MLAIGICGHDPSHLRQVCPYVTQASLERASLPQICQMAQDVRRRHYGYGIENRTPGRAAPIVDDNSAGLPLALNSATKETKEVPG
jgi:hypothetical protein